MGCGWAPPSTNHAQPTGDQAPSVIPVPYFVFPDSDRGTRGRARRPFHRPRPDFRRTGDTRYPWGKAGTRRHYHHPPCPNLYFVLPDSDPVPTPYSSSPTPIGELGDKQGAPFHQPRPDFRRTGDTRYPWGKAGTRRHCHHPPCPYLYFVSPNSDPARRRPRRRDVFEQCRCCERPFQVPRLRSG